MADATDTNGGSPLSSPARERLFRVLLEAYLDGTLDAKRLARMEQMMADDPALRAVFVEVSVQEQSARRLFGPTEELVLPGLEAVDGGDELEIETQAESSVLATLVDDALRARRLQEVTELAEHELTESRAKERSWAERRAQAMRAQKSGLKSPVPAWAVWGSMAALLFLGVWLGSVLTGSGGDGGVESPVVRDDPSQAGPANLAFLGDTVDAVWAGGRRPFYFRAGEPVTLSSGLVQMRFRDGATVVVQGPATFEATGSNAMRLVSGRLTAQVPDSATGFQVETVGGLVTDHGTEFGVWVDGRGRTLAQTFSGRITLAPPDGAGGFHIDEEVQLLAGDAAASDLAVGRVQMTRPDETAFVREPEFVAHRDAEGSAHARWLAYGYTLRRDPSVVAYYQFDDDDAQRGVLSNRAGGDGPDGRLGNGAEIAAPRWTAGRFPQTRALRFGVAGDGRTYGVVVPDDDALDLDGAMTFACWVRATDPTAFHGTLLSKRDVPPWRMNYQFSIMYSAQELQYGAGRDDATLAGFHYSRPNPQLSDARWHHVAVTTDGRTVRFYLDGEHVESLAQHLPPETNDATLLIGTSAVGGGVSFFDSAIPFLGEISEVLIARRAFDAAEIRALYDNSRGDD